MDMGGGEALIGTVSFGDSAVCRGNNYFQRLDTQIAWVDEQIKKYDANAQLPDAGMIGGGSDGGVADAAGAADAASARDLRAPDLASEELVDAGVVTPPARQDAAAPRPTPKPDARVAADTRKSDDDENGEYTQSLTSKGCAIASPREGATGGTALAGLIVAALVAVRRRRRSR
jgi:MYXO-CTERM domain-containing protein